MFSSFAYSQWQEINENIDYGNVNAVFMKNNDWIISTQSGGFYKSTDSGLNWHQIDQKLESNGILKIIGSGDTLIYVNATPSIFISTDFGDSWSKNSIGSQYQAEQPISLKYFNNKIYLGLKINTLISSDFGKSWNNKSSDTPILPKLIEQIDSNILISNNQEVYLCNANLKFINSLFHSNVENIYLLKVIDNIIFTSKSNYLFKSSNFGQTWDSVKVGNSGINNISKIKNSYFIVSDSIYVSNDNCKSWTKKNFIKKYGNTYNSSNIIDDTLI
jgi:hypothetical protein